MSPVEAVAAVERQWFFGQAARGLGLREMQFRVALDLASGLQVMHLGHPPSLGSEAWTDAVLAALRALPPHV